MDKKVIISRAAIKRYLGLGYKISNTDWLPEAWVKLYDADHVIDECGKIYEISNVTNDWGDYFVVEAPTKENRIYREYDAAWINRVHELFCEELNKKKVISKLYGRSCNCMMVIDLMTAKVGLAKCHPDDTFNPKMGEAIAYARLRGMTPKYAPAGTRLERLRGGVINWNDRKWWIMPYLEPNKKECTLISIAGPTLTNGHMPYTLSLTLPLDTIIPESDIVLAPSQIYSDIISSDVK